MNNRGFTTIELIIAILIAGTIMSAVGTFLVFNMRGFNTTKDIIDVQYEGQLGINQLSDMLKESEGFVEETLGSGIFMEDIDGNNVTLSFNTPEIPGRFKVENFYRNTSDNIERLEYVIRYDETSKEVFCKMTKYEIVSGSDILREDPPEYVLAKYVSGFTLEANSGNFQTTTSTVIRLNMQGNRADYDLQTEVKFRNKH